ncbi:cytochrome c [Geotalea uraniireducens]|uniref:Cytochrome c n=1 Tax=Geotalea uraniireducens TaxID=351604 RepID=A0ABM8EH16_9BACT|nr:cytochrome c3 family protein [Geotalea uraniireducens]BDV41724.1 cytochrome c [Geotalea uraniireducens]
MFKRRLTPALVLSLLVMLPMGVLAADKPQDECINCHGDKNISGKSGAHLYIDPLQYSETTHAVIGCTSCHESVTASHPDDGIRPSRATCKECHGPIQQEYSASLHANNAGCADCHNPHAVKPPMELSGKQMNTMCSKCHDTARMIKVHDKWLPQADLHIDALPCITCHTGSKSYVITMYIEKRTSDSPHSDFKVAKYEELSRFLPGDKDVTALIDKNGDNFISLEELRTFNKNAKYDNIRLWGMMTPEKVTHSYQILDNRWDCSFCHASGPKAMQTSFVAFPGKNGTFSRVAVEKGAILDLLYGTPDFYMMGSTRSTALSILGGLIISGGFLFAAGHGTLRFLTRNNRKEH